MVLLCLPIYRLTVFISEIVSFDDLINWNTDLQLLTCAVYQLESVVGGADDVTFGCATINEGCLG